MELVKIESINRCHSRQSAWSSDVLPSELQSAFYHESKHPIYETELLPVFVSVFLWGDMLKGSQVVCYLDNESAKAGLIKGYGGTEVANATVGGFCQRESFLQLKTWFSRVPTHNNRSHGPSRPSFRQTDSLGCTRYAVLWTEISGHIMSRLGLPQLLVEKRVCSFGTSR